MFHTDFCKSEQMLWSDINPLTSVRHDPQEPSPRSSKLASVHWHSVIPYQSRSMSVIKCKRYRSSKPKKVFSQKTSKQDIEPRLQKRNTVNRMYVFTYRRHTFPKSALDTVILYSWLALVLQTRVSSEGLTVKVEITWLAMEDWGSGLWMSTGTLISRDFL